MLFGVKWYLWLLLVVFIIITVIVCAKASEVSRKRRERMKKEAEIWKKDYTLRQNFKELTEEKINNTPVSELLHGVAMNIQIKLENLPNMEKGFDALPLPKKYIYTLEYFDEDAQKSLSLFFKNNGEPLIGLAAPALKETGLGDISSLVSELYPMYDPDSEVSVDRDIINRVDEQFKNKYNSDTLYEKCAEYIKENKEIFLNEE